MNRKALGKGLEALIPEAPRETASGLVRDLPVGEIQRNDEQPRSRFDEATMSGVQPRWSRACTEAPASRRRCITS